MQNQELFRALSASRIDAIAGELSNTVLPAILILLIGLAVFLLLQGVTASLERRRKRLHHSH